MYTLDDNDFHPESLMMTYGYNPEWSEGAVKCPIFQTSTFVFKNAEEGKASFDYMSGRKVLGPNESAPLSYSRFNNPDLEIIEQRLKLWDKAESCALFESGMSAIATLLLEYLQPGDLIVYSSPLYGGTDVFIKKFLSKFNINVVAFNSTHSAEEIVKIARECNLGRPAFVYVETPANPTCSIIDIQEAKKAADMLSTPDFQVVVAVDNTYMGPLWSHPLDHGADFVIYSATKYIGGHSDVIAGAVLGNEDKMARVKKLRSAMGTMAGPKTGWLLMRSLETLKIRMEAQARNSLQIVKFLQSHPKVEKIYYLGLIDENHPQYEVYKRQYKCAGAMVSFDIKGGEAECYQFLNSLKLIKLAVSLGGTESLAQHPASMTHSGVAVEEREAMSITSKMIRLSVGIEHYEDLIWDINQALATV